MTTNNDCPRCAGTVSQQVWVEFVLRDGGRYERRTCHGAMECEDCEWTEADGQPCETCGVYVPAGGGHDSVRAELRCAEMAKMIEDEETRKARLMRGMRNE